MSKQGIFKCYQLIIDKISRRPGVRFSELTEYLHDEGFEISMRTLQRYIEQIRNEFSVEINYRSSDKGYYIDEVGGPDMDLFLQLLSINDAAGVLIDSIKAGNVMKQYVQMENAGFFSGAHYIKEILDAAKKQKRISIIHKGFDSTIEKEYRLEPYLLKEFRGRWYVWGRLEGKKELRTFGLDRIIKLEVTNKKFERDKKVDPEKVFADTIGIIYSGDQPREVVLSFTPLMGKYVKGLPIHASQHLISENEREIQFRYFVSINPELKSIILSYGADVKVVSPAFLAKEIAGVYKRALKNY
jgi:predicted DNA-binding transcriptional regulator YafY